MVVGEGEVVWLDLLHDACCGQLQRRYSSFDRAEFNMANAPMPAYELLDISKYNRLTVQTSRGCPRRCEFCASSILLTRRYKQKSIPQVLGEIDRICELWPRPFIEFADDNALIHRAYWKELLPKLSRKQATNTLRRTIKKANASILKQAPVKAQSTTTKRNRGS